MASKELDTAIALERGLLQDFAALQTPLQFRACYSRFLGRFASPGDVRFEPSQADGV